MRRSHETKCVRNCRSPRGKGRHGALVTLLLMAGCSEYQPPAPFTSFDGIPVSGSLADARYAGFNSCFSGPAYIRCKRHGVMIEGQGPYDAAVELGEGDGSKGFSYVTVSSEKDQNALIAVQNALIRNGWNYCYTGKEMKGDQAIFTRDGDHVTLSMDISYSFTRRLRIFPGWNKNKPVCPPGTAVSNAAKKAPEPKGAD